MIDSYSVCKQYAFSTSAFSGYCECCHLQCGEHIAPRAGHLHQQNVLPRVAGTPDFSWAGEKREEGNELAPAHTTICATTPEAHIHPTVFEKEKYFPTRKEIFNIIIGSIYLCFILDLYIFFLQSHNSGCRSSIAQAFSKYPEVSSKVSFTLQQQSLKSSKLIKMA